MNHFFIIQIKSLIRIILDFRPADSSSDLSFSPKVLEPISNVFGSSFNNFLRLPIADVNGG